MIRTVNRRWGSLVLAALMLSPHISLAADQSIVNTSNQTANNLSAMRGFDPAILTGVNDPHPNTFNLMVGDPSSPSYYLAGSTQFGFGIDAGASDQTICQNRVDCDFTANASGYPEGGGTPMDSNPLAIDQTGDSGYYFLSYIEDGDDGTGNPLFVQGLRNEILSFGVDAADGCGSLGAQAGQARCNEIDFGFHQELAMIGTGSAVGGHGDGDQIFDLFFSIDSLVDADGNLIGDAVGTMDQSYTDVTAGVTTSNACTGTFTYSAASGYTQTSGAQGECP